MNSINASIESPPYTIKRAHSSFNSHKLLAGDRTSETFFSQIINAFLKEQSTNVAFIVVSHVVADLPDFLKALKMIGGRVALVIFKGSYDYRENLLYHDIQQKIQDQNIKEEDGKNLKENFDSDSRYVLQLIKNYINKGENFIILDIGGYFAQSLELLEKEEARFLGIVEDTENGHQRYETTLNPSDQSKSISSRVFSVARSQQKMTEDYNVGKSIVHATNNMLRDLGRKIEEFQHIGVIGFGKIGKSISQHLRGMHVTHLYVHDRDPNIAMQIASTDYQIASRNDIIKKCTLIFSATGNKALAYEDLLKMSRNGNREHIYIASVTSGSDEFDQRDFFKLKSKDIVHSGKNYGKSYYEKSPHARTKIHLLANGNAVNFFYGNNVIGDYIRAVQAAILVSAIKLISPTLDRGKKVLELERDDENIISRIWLTNFNKIDLGVQHNLTKIDQEYFIGRQATLKAVHTLLGQVGFYFFNLYGEAGVGKSDFITQYAHVNKNEYDIVWQINETSKHHALKKIYEKLHFTTQYADFETMLDKIAEKLSAYNYLLIFDITLKDDSDRKIQYLVKKLYERRKKEKRQHVVCISQSQCNSQFQSLLTEHVTFKIDSEELKIINKQETKEFIENYLKKFSNENQYESEQVEKLNDLLVNNNPIVLRLALKTFEACGLPIDKANKWLDLNIKNNDTLLTKLMRLSLEKLKNFVINQKPVFIDTLYILIYLNFYNINLNLLRKIIKNLNIGEEDTKHVLDKLIYHGLLTSRQESESTEEVYYMHQLVKQAIGDTLIQLAPARITEIQKNSIQVIQDHFKYNFYSIKPINYEEILFYKSHAMSLLTNLETDSFYLEKADIAKRLASFLLNEQRDYIESKKYYEDTIKYLNEHLMKERKRKRDSNPIVPININIEMLTAYHGKLVNMTQLYRKNGDKNTSLKDLIEVSDQMRGFVKEIEKYNKDEWILKEIPIAQSYVLRFRASDQEDKNEKLKHLQHAKDELNKVDQTEEKSPAKRSLSTNNIIMLTHHAIGSIQIKQACLSEDKVEKQLYLMQAIDSIEKSIKMKIPEIPAFSLSYSSHPTLARNYYHLGCAYYQLFILDNSIEHLASAKFYLQKAHEFQLEIFNNEHADLKQTNTQVEELEKKIQDLNPENYANYQKEYKKKRADYPS